MCFFLKRGSKNAELKEERTFRGERPAMSSLNKREEKYKACLPNTRCYRKFNVTSLSFALCLTPQNWNYEFC